MPQPFHQTVLMPVRTSCSQEGDERGIVDGAVTRFPYEDESLDAVFSPGCAALLPTSKTIATSSGGVSSGISTIR